MSQVQQNGATFQSMGLDIDQSVTLLGSFEESGYDSSQMLAALKKAAAAYNEKGEDMQTGLADLVSRLQDSSTQADATAEAYDLFGTKAGTTFVKAAESGKVNLTDLSGSLDSYASTVDDTFDATEDGVDKAQQAFKSLQEAGSTLGNALSDIMGPTLESAAEGIKSFADSLDSMSDDEKQGAANAIVLVAEIAAVVTVAGKAISGLKSMGTALTSAAQFFAKVGGAADTADEAIEASSVAMGVAKTAALTLAAVGIAVLVDKIYEYTQKQEEFTKATKGLSDAANNTESLKTYSGNLKNVGDAASSSAESVDDMISDLADSADTINQTNQEAESQIDTLTSAKDIIDQYSGMTDLSTSAQGRLQWAVQQINDEFGTTISVADVATGSYKDQNGEVQNLKQSIDNLVASKETEIKETAIESDLTQAYEDQREAAASLAAAQDKYNSDKADYIQKDMEMNGVSEEAAEKDWEVAASLDGTNDSLSKAQTAYDGTTNNVQKYTEELGDTAAAASDSADAYTKWASTLSEIDQATLEQHGTTFGALSDDLRDLGVNTDDLSNLSSDDMDKLANDYDGTESSIISDLSSMGVHMDETKEQTAQAVSDMSSSIASLSDSGSVDLDSMGMSANDLAKKLSDAGVTTQAQTAIANGNFADLYKQSGGDIDKLITKLQNYDTTIAILNKTGIDPKTVTVNDDGSITTETGAIVSLDEIKIGDKTYQIGDDGSIETQNGELNGLDAVTIATKNYTVTDDGSISFENGNVVNLDNQTINGKHFTVSDDGTITVENSNVEGLNWNNIDNKDFYVSDDGSASQASTNVDNVTTSVDNVPSYKQTTLDAENGSAMSAINSVWDYLVNLTSKTWTVSIGGNGYGGGGGGGAYAAGGIRPHADGGIRYHASGGSIVTKATPLDIVGEAGAEAIIPLTNRQYVTPFAATVAEQMIDTIKQLNGSQSSGDTYYLSVDGNTINDVSKMDERTRTCVKTLIRLASQ
jgi:hypothetical protein